MVELAIRSFNWRHGYVTHKVPNDVDAIDDEALITQILKIIERKGALAQNIKIALENDGVIDYEEFTQIEFDIQQCITGLVELKNKVKAMHE